MAEGRFEQAEFWARRAWSVDPDNREAIRLLAESEEAQDKPEALPWRIKASQGAPADTGAVLAWAKCAFRFGQSEMGLKVLARLPEGIKARSAEYHELIAGSALSAREGTVAEEHFVKAAELDPDNPLHRVNLAAFRLGQSSDALVRKASALELEGLLEDARVSLFATRALWQDARQRGDQARVRQLTGRLLALPGHTFGDEVNCLGASAPGPDLTSALGPLQRRAETRPEWVTQLGEWLNAHGMAGEMLHWQEVLPPAIRSNPRVQMTIADSYLRLRDWRGLAASLANSQWAGGDYLRRAMLIRTQKELSQPWKGDWEKLVEDSQARPAEGLLLAQLVLGWGWRDEAVNLLWKAATLPEVASLALQSLWELYARDGDSRKLLRVARAQSELDPANPTKINNEAFLSLLIEGFSERAERLARALVAAHPSVPEWTATEAFALHLAHRDVEAGQMLATLPPEAQHRPGVALYFALVQAALGETVQAQAALARLNPAHLLPEERKLATELAQQLQVRNSDEPSPPQPARVNEQAGNRG